MSEHDSQKPPQHLHPSDLRSAAQLAVQATSGVVDIAEGVHRSVLGTLGIPGAPCGEKTRGLTGLIYQTVRDAAHYIGLSLDTIFSLLEPLMQSVDQSPLGSPERVAILAALNGVMGDSLASHNNPLAIEMTVRYQGKALDWRALPSNFKPKGKVLLMIHGLCMNDLQWGEQHAAALASKLAYTPLYLRYNTGLHISQNGGLLSTQLEQLVSECPTPLEELTVIAHSMGGLVMRAALHNAKRNKLLWPQHLKNIVFLGTPHHGSPLERAGSWVDVILGSTPYTTPFSKLGKIRSAGITDLRYGYVLEEDWQGQDRFQAKSDDRTPLPLPTDVACYAVAAAIARERGVMTDQILGDGLVPVPSALGQHEDKRRNLSFGESSQWIAYGMNHMDLLKHPDVTQQIQTWLSQELT